MTARWLCRLSMAALAVLVIACRSDSTEPKSLTIAAAADLALVLAEMRPMLEEASGGPVEFVLGSSGLLKEQVLAGAPYDLYFSADITFAEELVAVGESADGVVYPYAIGRIAVVVRAGLPQIDALSDLVDAVYQNITIANPAHAPYGRAGREALISAGIWDAIQPRLVMGENIRQSVEYVRGRNVDAGIVALSLVVTGDSPYWLVPAKMHQPLLQGAVIIAARGQDEAARRVLEVILSDDGAEVLARYGFERVD